MELTIKALPISPIQSALEFEAGGKPVERCVLQLLEWDSRMLGRPCARLEDWGLAASRSVSYAALVAELSARGLEYVTTRLAQADWSRIHALEAAGFRLLDGILDFNRKLSHPPPPSASSFSFRLATGADAEAVGQLARRTFTQSRFHNDPHLSAELAGNVHYEWGKNSCLGQAARAVCLAENGTELAGFVTCQTHGSVGRIGLIAVNSRLSGKGLGQALVQRASLWFSENACDEVFVQTQTDNFAAMRLYLRAGFVPAAAKVTLRWSARESL